VIPLPERDFEDPWQTPLPSIEGWAPALTRCNRNRVLVRTPGHGCPGRTFRSL